MKIQVIEGGNFTSWLRLSLIVIGITFAVIAAQCNLPIVLARVLLLSGFAIALVGGMTSRAKLLHICSSYPRPAEASRALLQRQVLRSPKIAPLASVLEQQTWFS
ncbi:hypothetical protein [Paraburkholderia caledonica]|uniref:DUF202 domain-containing protein n=1 Tax=Paraburkholderia caledonica TaxID=134536 RepID=A0AB73INZ5_9BURK|nr:hypothetical protein [Paraburkholderia caledonica]